MLRTLDFIRLLVDPVCVGRTYHTMYLHLIWGTYRRHRSMYTSSRRRIHAYMIGLIRKRDAVPLAIGGVDDHIHLLISINPTVSPSNLVRDVKIASSRWISTMIPRFKWQEGFGCFTVGPSEVDRLRKYILNQESHHQGA